MLRVSRVVPGFVLVIVTSLAPGCTSQVGPHYGFDTQADIDLWTVLEGSFTLGTTVKSGGGSGSLYSGVAAANGSIGITSAIDQDLRNKKIVFWTYMVGNDAVEVTRLVLEISGQVDFSSDSRSYFIDQEANFLADVWQRWEIDMDGPESESKGTTDLAAIAGIRLGFVSTISAAGARVFFDEVAVVPSS